MKDDRIYLFHMLQTCQKISMRVQSMTREAFNADEDVQLAITHLLQTVGEAARMVSEETRMRFCGIEWRKITGMRHRIVHDYLNVDFSVVWDTATISIPPLAKSLQAALAELGYPQTNENMQS